MNNMTRDDFDIIRHSMLRQRMGIKPLVDPAEKESQKNEELVKKVINKKEAFKQGYDLCTREIENRSIDGVFASYDHVPPIPKEAFKINENAIKSIDHLEFWNNYIKNPSEIQFLLGYTDDMLLSLYCLAGIFYDNKQHEEAVKIHTFLCLLNPTISSFWIGLGLSEEGKDELQKAIEAYETAAQVGPSSFAPYTALIRCSEKLHDYSKIIEQLTKACENPDIKEDAKAALEYLATKTKTRGLI